MSDNEDLLADDLNDHSLADYNLGNDEEDQLLADDFDAHVPSREYLPEPALPLEEPSASYEEVPLQVPYVEPAAPSYGTLHEELHVTRDSYSDSYSNGVSEERVVPNVAEPSEEQYNKYGERVYMMTAEVPQSPVAEVVPTHIVHTTDGAVPEEPPARERFPAERPVGAPRVPRVRDIPDSLDKVLIPRHNQLRPDARTWRNPQYRPRMQSHPYRRVNPRHPDFLGLSRPPYQPPNSVQIPPPEFNQRVGPQGPPLGPPGPLGPQGPPPQHFGPPRPPFGLQRPPMQRQPMPERPPFQRPPNIPFSSPERFPPPFQSNQPPPPGAFGPMEERPNFRPERPNFRPQRPNFQMERPLMQFRGPPPFANRPPMNFRPGFDPRMPGRDPGMPGRDPGILGRDPGMPGRDPGLPERDGGMPGRDIGMPARDIAPNPNRPPMPRINMTQPIAMLPTIEVPNLPANSGKMDLPPPPGVGDFPPREREVRLLPVQLPSNIPLAGKKVLINPHFKGNIQPAIDATGPPKDIDDAAERFIAEQRSALARAAQRKPQRRSPQRFVENLTVHVVDKERELLRLQEEFISANRAGLRRRMRSPTPPRRSPTPPLRRQRLLTPPPVSPQDNSEESEYKRRLRDQETLRERVLRAKEVRRRKNAVSLQRQIEEKERERDRVRLQTEKDKNPDHKQEIIQRQEDRPKPVKEQNVEKETKTDINKDKQTNIKTSEEKVQKEEKEKIQKEEKDNKPAVEEAREKTKPKTPEYERDLTPPLPVPTEVQKNVSRVVEEPDEDALDLIIDELDGILSDDDDSGRFKEKAKPAEAVKPRPADLRSKLAPRRDQPTAPRQKIVFNDDGDKRRRDKSPAKRSQQTATEEREPPVKVAKVARSKPESVKKETESREAKQRSKIVFEKKVEEDEKSKPQPKASPPFFPSRRVVLQRKIQPAVEKSVFSRIEKSEDPTKPTAGIFSRAVRTAIGSKSDSNNQNRVVLQRNTSNDDDTKVEVETDSDSESLNEDMLLRDDDEILTATVTNLPHGMTDARLKTLAGNDVQSLKLDNERRSAKITFKSNTAAEGFKKKFNNKMVAASRLTVVLR